MLANLVRDKKTVFSVERMYNGDTGKVMITINGVDNYLSEEDLGFMVFQLAHYYVSNGMAPYSESRAKKRLP